MKTLTLTASDGIAIAVSCWLPPASPRAVVQIVHGMAEHAGRYHELAQALNAAGYAVYAHDQRGHGQTAARVEDLGYLGAGTSWRTCLDDIVLVQRRIVGDLPGRPLFLLGHSMGSFLAQQFAAEQSGVFRGLVLSGSYRERRTRAWAAARLARLERWQLGPRGRSRIIRALTFDAFNRRFAPTRTNFDWLSRDEATVDAYAADARCGFEPSVQLWIELLDALAAGLPLPPPQLPICVLSGERDPVAATDPGASRLVEDFRRAGLHRITHRIYPAARHELFHETNREEVFRDLITWLGALTPGN